MNAVKFFEENLYTDEISKSEMEAVLTYMIENIGINHGYALTSYENGETLYAGQIKAINFIDLEFLIWGLMSGILHTVELFGMNFDIKNVVKLIIEELSGDMEGLSYSIERKMI